MKREEAIKLLKQYQGYEPMFPDGETLKHAFDLTDETVDTLLSALRPVSRERVERMFPGCDFCNMADFGEFGFEITKHYAKICCALGSWRFPGKEQFLFCPKCGKPLTDEAVQMVMERLEALKDE
jgi:Zn finger protein HypA/HybF involved in hydrogenase expression